MLQKIIVLVIDGKGKCIGTPRTAHIDFNQRKWLYCYVISLEITKLLPAKFINLYSLHIEYSFFQVSGIFHFCAKYLTMPVYVLRLNSALIPLYNNV